MPTLPFDLSEYAREAMARVAEERATESKGGKREEFDPQGVPSLRVSQEELMRSNLSHKGGFLVSLLDGISTVEMIVDVAGMPREEALGELQSLYLKGLIEFV